MEETTKDKKVIEFNPNSKTYKKIADGRMEKEDLVGALSCLLSSLKKEFDIDTVVDIADIYADMGLYEMSNKYWFIYLANVNKSERAKAYIDLAMNYFYLDKTETSAIYLKKKVEEDGFIAEESIEPEILKYFQEEAGRKKIFKLVYPERLADYSEEVKKAKRAIGAGDIEGAISLLSSVPEGCPQFEEASDDLATAYYLCDEYEKGIATVKNLIKIKGETAGRYAKLSNLYYRSKDFEKSEYYYNKALEIFNGDDIEDVHKVAYSAFVNGDGKTALKCMEKIIPERKYDVIMLLFYGLALIDCKDYKKAEEQLKRAYMIDPSSGIVEFYLRGVEKLVNGKSADELFPISFFSELPDREFARRVELINTVNAKSTKAIRLAFKNEEIKKIYDWGLNSKNPMLEEICAFAFMKAELKECKEALKQKLIDPFTADKIKYSIIYYLVFGGEKKKISLETHDMFVQFKAHRFPWEKEERGKLVFAGYSLALSIATVTVEGDYSRISMSADKVYKKTESLAKECEKEGNGLSREDYAAIILFKSGLTGVSVIKVSAKLCGIKESRLKNLLARLDKE